MKPSRRRLIAVFALAGLTAIGCGPSCSCSAPLPENEPITVYIVRHAETLELSEHAPEAKRVDSPLSAAGQVRALKLPEELPIKDLAAVYVTDTKRSRDTASAVVALNGIKPIIYPPRDVDGLAYRLRKRSGQSALVVGHSNTIPPLLDALGVEPPIEIGEDQYGDLWVVTVTGSKTKLERRRFGESTVRVDRAGPRVK